MYLYLVSTNGFVRSKEVTELALQISCRVSILRIVLSCHEMFEIAHVLDVQEVLGCTLW